MPPSVARGNGAWPCLPSAVQESIADELVDLLVKFASGTVRNRAQLRQIVRAGPAGFRRPRKWVTDWIEKGIAEGAKLVLDGRGVVVKGHEAGFYMGR